jgi:GNAT superfamily N-acetyltransferase
VGVQEVPEVIVRVAAPVDAAALAGLRALWSAGSDADPVFERRMDEWLSAEGERRTTWLAELGGEPVGMASLFEYRRMPHPGRPATRWGYLSNMFVREELRDRGIGEALLNALVTTADERGYARILLSPSDRAIPFYARAGFIVPDAGAGDDRLLVRPAPAT